MSIANKVILHPRDGGGIAVVSPCECGLTLEQIARKDVPAGMPFLIVDRSELPSDLTYFEAWTADFSEPDGVGIGAAAWFAEQAQNNGG